MPNIKYPINLCMSLLLWCLDAPVVCLGTNWDESENGGKWKWGDRTLSRVLIHLGFIPSIAKCMFGNPTKIDSKVIINSG